MAAAGPRGYGPRGGAGLLQPEPLAGVEEMSQEVTEMSEDKGRWARWPPQGVTSFFVVIAIVEKS